MSKIRKPIDITFSNTSISENLHGGTIVASLGAINSKGKLTIVEYKIEGEDAHLFYIKGNNIILRDGVDLDYETISRLNFTVIAKNTKGSCSENVVINITDVNEPPTEITLIGGSVSETASSGSVAGILSSTDPENDPLTYRIIGGTGASTFVVSGRNILVAEGVILDHETLSHYTMDIEVSDNGGNSYVSSVTILISDSTEDGTSNYWSASINYIEDRADYNFIWTVAYDLVFDGFSLDVITRIDLTGDMPATAILEQWETGIESLWNGFALQSTSGSLIPIIVDVQFVDDGNGEHYDVEIVDGAGRTNMLTWYLDTAWGPAYYDEIAAHEYGHMIGNFDEYPGGATYAEYTTSNTLMSDLSHNMKTSYLFGVEYFAEFYGGVQYDTVLI